VAFWRRLGRHLFVRAYPFWIAVGGIALVAAVAVAIGGTPVEEATIAGAGMELLGLATVAVGLSKLGREFGRPSLFDSLGSWFRDLPAVFKKQPPRIINSVGGISITPGTGSALLTVKAAPGSPIEKRVELLEKAVDLLRDYHGREIEKLDQAVERVAADLTIEQRERAQVDERLRTTVEELAVGGLHVEVVGVVWLFFGIFLGTLPEQSVAIIRSALRLIR